MKTLPAILLTCTLGGLPIGALAQMSSRTAEKSSERLVQRQLAANEPPVSLTCADQVIKNALSHHDKLEAKIAPTYFQDIGKDSMTSCFEIKRGKVYPLGDTHLGPNGIKLVEIHDLDSDTYRWVPESRLNHNGPKNATVANPYFREHASTIKSCFEMTKNKTYPVVDSRASLGIFYVEIYDSSSGIYQWFASERIDLVGNAVTKKCGINPDLPAHSGYRGIE